ncbi:DoxX family protein [Anatilimnocola floriformis]|uniref:DoxX family protein n=1 Tax=Anatilimnocola floriformis TaxID=2948575 RepID=UPI0020C34E09|nr:DoxX family protein [Anatilimnocola floriformis]
MSQAKLSSPDNAAQPKWMTISGWVLTVLITLAMSASAFMKLTVPLKIGDHEKLAADFEKGGFSVQTMTAIACVEIFCALVYLFPQTAVLGAVLLEGYLGGAICVHVIGKQPIWAPLIIGVVMWLGIYLREPRLRSIMPLR